MIRIFANNISTRVQAIENVRFISQTSRWCSEKAPATSKPAESEAPAAGQGPAQAWSKKKTRTLTGYDKRILVWTGKYKSIGEVPDTVSHETLDRARDKFRVKSCIWMMIACVKICIVQIIRGKQAAERGESVIQDNLDWHREYNEKAAEKATASK